MFELATYGSYTGHMCHTGARIHSYLAIAIYGYGHLHIVIYPATATPGYS